jgi:transcriptional regulator with XRE-family HTH domain
MNDFEGSSEPSWGVAITLLRGIRGWTQADLARAAGVASSLIAKVERGRKALDLKTLERLIAAMGFSIQSLQNTRRLIESVRAESLRSADGDPNPNLPPASVSFGGAGDPLFRLVSPADLNGEVERLSAEACRALRRLTELVVVLISHVAETQQEKGRNGIAE